MVSLHGRHPCFTEGIVMQGPPAMQVQIPQSSLCLMSRRVSMIGCRILMNIVAEFSKFFMVVLTNC